MNTSNGSSMNTPPSYSPEELLPANQPDDDGWITVSSRRSHKAEAKRNGRIVQRCKINDLPNSIVVHILSFLPTTQAAQTCVLSRRWRYLWAYIPTLIIDEYGRNEAYKMNKFLQLCRSPFLRRVSLMLRESVDYQSCFRWIDFAMKHKDVEELDLEVTAIRHFDENFFLPRNIFSCSQLLRVLVLHGCELRNIGQVDLRNVRKLSFKNIIVVGNSLNDLLTASPRAEILELECCSSVIDLSANLPNLKNLILIACNQLKSAKLTVPKLKVVKIEDYESPLECFLLSGMVNLMEAYIFIYGAYQVYNSKVQVCANLLQNLGQAKQLRVNCSSFEIMNNWSRVIADGSAMKVIRFELINRDHSHSTLSLMPALLKKLPNLEEFRLHNKYRNWFRAEDARNGPNYGDSLPIDCLHQCLKRISIVDYNNEKQELELVKVLLQNAIALEKISFLNCYGDFIQYCELIEILKKCKASPKAEIVFEDESNEFDCPGGSDFRVAIT